MTSVLKRASNSSASDRNGLCRATTRSGEPCRRKALDADGLCLVHNGSQDMRELGRLGGRATPKTKRADGRRETLREFLRREVSPADVWAAIQSGLASANDRDKLAAAKLLLGELYEPGAERQRLDEAEAARSRQVVMHRIDTIARRRVLEGLVESGLIRPGEGRPFEGAVMFDLRELAEWTGAWTPRPLEISDVTCSTCGRAGVQLVKEGEAVDGGPVYCATCKAVAEEATASSPQASVEAATWPRTSLT
jgi:hypothetical protein